MRRPAQASSFLYHPLDTVLGTVGTVRVLRVLSLQRGAMTAAAVARRARLGRSGAGRALGQLAATGIVDPGTGARPQYRLSESNAMALALRALFEEEAARVDRFLKRVRQAARRMKPAPKAVWLVGSAARAQDTAHSDLDLAIVHARGTLAPLRALNGVVERAAADLGASVSLISFSLPDVERLASSQNDWWRNLVAEAIPVLGPAPRSLLRG